MTGEFGIWQLTSEGLRNTGGTAVNMLFPVSRATLFWDGQRYEVADGIAIGTVQLGLLADGTRHKLVVDHSKGVRITEFRGGDAEAAEYFKMALEAFLRANMDIFKHSFAAVDFNQKAAKEISWLTPKAAGYWYSGGKDDNESCLAVLCMTENYVAGNPTPAPTLSSGLIPVGATCALLLSRQLFVRNLLLPAVTDGLGLRCDPATEKKLKPEPHELRKARIDRWFELQEHDARIVKKPKTGSIPVGKRRVDVSWLYGVIATGGGVGLGNPWVLIHCLGLAAATFLINLVTQRGQAGDHGRARSADRQAGDRLPRGRSLFQGRIARHADGADPLQATHLPCHGGRRGHDDPYARTVAGWQVPLQAKGKACSVQPGSQAGGMDQNRRRGRKVRADGHHRRHGDYSPTVSRRCCSRWKPPSARQG